jgi:hypothetical protein
MTIQDDFRQFSEDESLIMKVNQKPDRSIHIIDVGNASKEAAEEAIQKLREKFKGT